MRDEFDDTVLVSSRRDPRPSADIDEDTVVLRRTDPRDEKPRADDAQDEGYGVTHDDTGSATPPALVEPAVAKPRRVPLTQSRLAESLRPAPSRPPQVRPTSRQSSIPAPTPSAKLPPATARSERAFVFRVSDHPPITLDVPAIVGRRPLAPRIPGTEPARLVRVASPLNEVSGTHVELRQEGSSVVVTDLRSTNGTVVRMPGSHPITLRQGESLVVRPGTLVDIGDGNVIEILSPPRLGASHDGLGARGDS